MVSGTVLVVDDSVAVRRAVSLMVTGAGCTCLEAADGGEALRQLDKNLVDVIVTDLNMPIMDGRTLIHEVRNREGMRFVPILVLTTECHDEVISELKRNGVTGVLQKPVTRGELLGALTRAGIA